MKKTIYLAFAALTLYSCGGKEQKMEVPKNDTLATTKPTEKKVENWSYNEDVDKMTNEKKLFAYNKSTNTIDFEFPYDGGSTFTLTLRKTSKANEIILSVSKGQFMPNIMEDKSVKIKFDEQKPFEISYNGTSDGSSDVIFLQQTSKLLSLLKSSKKLMIEAEFYNAGKKIIEFDVDGLKWD